MLTGTVKTNQDSPSLVKRPRHQASRKQVWPRSAIHAPKKKPTRESKVLSGLPYPSYHNTPNTMSYANNHSPQPPRDLLRSIRGEDVSSNARATPSTSANKKLYFFLPLPFGLAGAELLETTLVARDVEAEAESPLPFTLSSCLFCLALVDRPWYRWIRITCLDTILGLLFYRNLLFLITLVVI